MTEDGQAEPVVHVVEQPGGLGWLPDGRLLVVSMLSHALLRLDEEGLTEVAEHSNGSLSIPGTRWQSRPTAQRLHRELKRLRRRPG